MHLALHNKLSCFSGRCHLIRRFHVLEATKGNAAHKGRARPHQISHMCWVFLLQSLLMNVACSLLFANQAWCLPNGRRKRAIAFPSAPPSHTIFSDEALYRGNSHSSLQDKDCSHYPILFWPCNGMKKGLFSSSFFACPGCWPSTYFCLKLFSLKLKYSWSSI